MAFKVIVPRGYLPMLRICLLRTSSKINASLFFRRKQSASTSLDTRSSTPASPISSPLGYVKSHFRISGYEVCSPIEEITDHYRKHAIASPVRSRAEAPLIMRKHPNLHEGQLLSPIRNQHRLSQIRQPAIRTPTGLVSPTGDRRSSLGSSNHSPNPHTATSVEALRKVASSRSPTLIPRPANTSDDNRESTPTRKDIRQTEEQVRTFAHHFLQKGNMSKNIY